MNRFGLVGQIGMKMQMFCYKSLTGCGQGDSLEQLDIEELKIFASFLGIPFQHLLNNLFPIHGNLVQQTACQVGWQVLV